MVGVPGVKNVPWMYFLVIPLIAFVLRAIFKVFEIAGSIILMFVALDSVVWMYNHWLSTGDSADTYRMVTFRILGWCWDAFVGLLINGWEAVTGLF